MRPARLALVVLTLAASAAAPAGSLARAAGAPAPVVVELFTSELCHACPPADAALQRLAHDQPVAGAQVVALELHVDYFDGLKGADPYAQASFGARQADYQRAFGKSGRYTPQFVVDGQREVGGARESEVRDAVSDAARAQKARVEVVRAGDRLTITVDGLKDLPGGEAADLWLAVTEDGLSSHSEQFGQGGEHGPVVRDLRRVAPLGDSRDKAVFRDIELKLDGGWRLENLRAVAFVQRSKTMEILGAGTVALR